MQQNYIFFSHCIFCIYICLQILYNKIISLYDNTFLGGNFMRCNHCGTQFEETIPSCPNCGAPANSPLPGGQEFYLQNPLYDQVPPYDYSHKLSKKEFFKHPNLKKVAVKIRSSAIGLYFCAAISLIVLLLTDNFTSLLDVGIVLGLGLGVHLAQSRVCAILVCIYSVINMLVLTFSSGTLGGWLILLASISAVLGTFSFQNAWAEYKRTSILPAAF